MKAQIQRLKKENHDIQRERDEYNFRYEQVIHIFICIYLIPLYLYVNVNYIYRYLENWMMLKESVMN